MIEPVSAAARREDEEYAGGIWRAHPRQLASIRLELRRWLAPLGMTGDAQEDLVLAVSEAAGNSVEHAYPEPSEDDTVELIFRAESGVVCIEIVDHGMWRTPPTGSLGRGRGISVMRGLMESVLIQHGPEGTRVLLRHPVRDSALSRAPSS